MGLPVTVPLMRASCRSADRSAMTSWRNWSRRGDRWDTSRAISSYRFGYSIVNERSSSSHFTVFMPSRCASGAKISSVSRALRSCFSRGR